jgi:hypothetical protein
MGTSTPLPILFLSGLDIIVSTILKCFPFTLNSDLHEFVCVVLHVDITKVSKVLVDSRIKRVKPPLVIHDALRYFQPTLLLLLRTSHGGLVSDQDSFFSVPKVLKSGFAKSFRLSIAVSL